MDENERYWQAHHSRTRPGGLDLIDMTGIIGVIIVLNLLVVTFYRDYSISIATYTTLIFLLWVAFRMM